MLLFACDGSPLHEGGALQDVKVEYAFVQEVDRSSATIIWKCSTPARGLLFYGRGSLTETMPAASVSELQAVVLNRLSANSEYTFQPVCGPWRENRTWIPMTFRTLSVERAVSLRSIWIVGGIGLQDQPVGQVDLFDPVTGNWTAAVTQVPTPRAYSQIVAHKGKIYVIGGMTKSGGAYAMSGLVEMYNPTTNSWATLASMPTMLQGGLVASVGDAIYLIAGTTTTDMTTGTLTDTVYRFLPENGATGSWSTYTAQSAILRRVDMSGCVIGGTLFFQGGRLATDGSAFATADGYIPSANTTTGLVEAALNQARHGAATACYRPLASDPFPTDQTALLTVGGSTGTNVFQPPTFIIPSDRYDYYAVGGATNTVTAGPTLPSAVYYPAAEVSYESRALFVFGGATAVNVPVTAVHSLSLATPVAGTWTARAAMPVARYAHRAVIIDR